MKMYSIFVFLLSVQTFAMHNEASNEPSAPPATSGSHLQPIYPPAYSIPNAPVALMPRTDVCKSTAPTTIGLKPNTNIDNVLARVRLTVLPAYHQLLAILKQNRPLSEADAKAQKEVASAITSFFQTFFTASPSTPQIEKQSIQTSPAKCTRRDCGFLNSCWGQRVFHFLTCNIYNPHHKPDNYRSHDYCWGPFPIAGYATLGLYPLFTLIASASAFVIQGVVYPLTLPCQYEASCAKYSEKYVTSNIQWNMLAEATYAVLRVLVTVPGSDGQIVLQPNETLEAPPQSV